jgi:dTDP-glucose 4,6-dehydratase
MRLLVTGGAGFIGSALVRRLINETTHDVLNVDALNYAGDLSTIADIYHHPRHNFLQADITDGHAMDRAVNEFAPHAIMHLAAQTHVDRSIDGPGPFVATNIQGTFTLLEAVRRYFVRQTALDKKAFRYIHISTDEVYGDLTDTSEAANTESPYHPSSPYAASKAAADQLVQAWARTYNLPVILTHCSNNYGPRQFPEKLIPLTIERAMNDEPIPVYGDGLQIRDWLHVEDHVTALLTILDRGQPGMRYHIAGGCQITNLDLIKKLCRILDHLRIPSVIPGHHERLIKNVEDRPGHDRRYALDDSTTRIALNWQPKETLDSGLEKTVPWYLSHIDWREQIRRRRYAGERLGLAK